MTPQCFYFRIALLVGAFYVGFPFFTTVALAEEVKSSTKTSSLNDFFAPLNPSFEEQIVGMYKRKTLFDKNAYLKLRHILAQKAAQDIKYLIDEHWNDEEFCRWIQKHPELLETFLLALVPEHDDRPQALKIMKRIWERWPELLAKYPELAVAICVTWDKSSTGSPKAADAYDNFLFYTSEKVPANRSAKALPWELLIYVVSNKASLDERRWILEHYGKKTKKIGGCYFDVRWKSDTELHKHERTVPNMKKYGGVCTVQAEYALLVCRTMGVPAFYGWPGHPKYHGGHSWIMWLEIKNASNNAIQFTRESSGRYGNRKDHTCHSPNPQTAVNEDEGKMYIRFQQIGRDLRSYRHSEMLMRIYPVLLRTDSFKNQQRLEFLEAVAKLSPGSEKAWREIANLGREGYFSKKDLPKISKLIDRMFLEMSASPNLIPGLTENLLAFEDAKSEKLRIYQKIMQRMKTLKRPDLVFATVKILVKFLEEENQHKEIIDIVGQTALLYHEEASRMAPLLKIIEDTASNDKKFNDGVSRFYALFVEKVLNPKADVPEAYRRDMLARSIDWAGKVGDFETQNKGQLRLQQMLHEKNKGK